MKKFVLALATVLLFAPAAQAATVYDLTFTGTWSLFGSPTPASGTGTVTTTGGSATGLEFAAPFTSNPKLTDVQIDLGLAHFDLSDAVFASLTTLNGSPIDFSYNGFLSYPGKFFPKLITLNTLPGNSFLITDGLHNNLYSGNFTIEAISAVPEPATWAMLLLGFGSIGLLMRARRRSSLAA
ncbi:MAG TPA: FxDxF family PEP-CTERM protein [Rhizomicrobium sp.]|jgi:hypothetical protein